MQSNKMPIAGKVFLATIFFAGVALVVFGRAASDRPVIGSEFHVEGFQKAKIIGISNGRAIVVLTNNVGQNSYEELSLNTVEMLKSLPW
jgi:hypothetical protein